MYKIIGGDQREYGPISVDQMRQWIAEARIDARTRVCAEGSNDWKPLATFPELAALLPSQLPPLTAPPLASTPYGQPRPDIPNYLVHSILVTVCCCLPLGIVAVIYSAQVGTKLSIGDLAGATAASNNAKLWCWIGLACGVITNVVGIAIMLAGGLNKF